MLEVTSYAFRSRRLPIRRKRDRFYSVSGYELTTSRLARDLVLPLWKSNVSVTLMIDKKAKRCVGFAGATAHT